MAERVIQQSLLEEFRSEFSEFWPRLSDKAFFFSLLAVWAALFHFWGHCSFNFSQSPSIFTWMWGAYSAEALDSSHGKLIPFVVLFLLWFRRKQLLELAQSLWWPSLFGLALCLFLHVIGYMMQQPRISIIAFFGGIYSLLGLVWGRRFVMACFFPFLFFVFCVPFGNTLDRLTFPLRLISTTATWMITRGILGIPVVQQGTQLIDVDGGYSYEVAAACSGIRSLIPLFVLSVVYGTITFKSVKSRWLVVLAVVPLALFCNMLRLITIILTHNLFGSHAAHFVHEWFGFVTYAIALGALLWLGSWLEKKSPEERKQPDYLPQPT